MKTNQTRVRITHEYKVQYPDPLHVRAGERVSVGHEDKQCPHWKWCKGPDGREGWVPIELLGNEGPEAVVLEDYSARELAVQIGEDVIVEEARHNWLLVNNRKGERGWIPAHWTVNVSSSVGHGKLYADAYSIAPAGIFVPPESPIKNPPDLTGVPISVGYQSGSHYSSIQALEQYLKSSDIKLSFAEGLLFKRMELLFDRKIPAASLFSGPYYFMEQLGFRKIIDTTFMIASMITREPDAEDVRKYFGALRKAQSDIDLRPERYTHYYKKEFPERFDAMMDTRRWGPGERLVFEPYTKEMFESAYQWIAQHEIFPKDKMGSGIYEESVVSLAVD